MKFLSLSKTAKKIKNVILDTLFPINCLGCGKDFFWICEECFQKIPINREQICPACEREITFSGTLCKSCRRKRRSKLDALVTAASYEDPLIKKMVYNLKYRFVADFSHPLARIETKVLHLQNIPLPSFIVPVPLHPRRLRWRGFNQAKLIAKNISQNLTPPLQIPVLDILERKKHNKPQMEVKNYQDRLQNVKNIFCLKPDFDFRLIQGRKLLLVDDIATTGATLEECARILKRAGAKKVFAIVVARQTLKK